MSDFTSEFWSIYVAVIALLGIIGCGVLLWSQSKIKVAADAKHQDDGTQEGHHRGRRIVAVVDESEHAKERCPGQDQREGKAERDAHGGVVGNREYPGGRWNIRLSLAAHAALLDARTRRLAAWFLKAGRKFAD